MPWRTTGAPATPRSPSRGARSGRRRTRPRRRRGTCAARGSAATRASRRGSGPSRPRVVVVRRRWASGRAGEGKGEGRAAEQVIFLVFATVVSLGVEGKRRSVAASPANWQVGPCSGPTYEAGGGPARAPEDGKWVQKWWTDAAMRHAGELQSRLQREAAVVSSASALIGHTQNHQELPPALCTHGALMK